jgi:hypothetical protein
VTELIQLTAAHKPTPCASRFTYSLYRDAGRVILLWNARPASCVPAASIPIRAHRVADRRLLVAVPRASRTPATHADPIHR